MSKLLLVGCGKMGAALLRGICAAGSVSAIAVVKPTPPSADLQHLPNVSWVNTAEALPPAFRPDAIIIAVKPQMIAAVLPAYARFTGSVFLSVAAGKTLARLATLLGKSAAAIVRTMPNLPSSIGQGMTIAIANSHVSKKQHALCDTLLSAIGMTAWIEDETLMDAMTALSGCGPAYVFALCEAMSKAGESLGLSSSLAAQLARQTIIGSGALLGKVTESPEDLRRAVTSPNGVTEAALTRLLAEGGLNALMLDAMRTAVARSKELAG